MSKTLIRNGTVVDGTGAPAFAADVRIRDGVITAVQPGLQPEAGEQVVDASGCHVTRAIHQEYPLNIEYHSISSGRTERVIVPFALIDNGLRWHVRAFDRKSQEFRDFVITRIKHPERIKSGSKEQAIAAHERSDQDIQWTRIVELELVPHPDQPHPEITEMDYAMQDGMIRMKLRAAMAGYVLRKWSVDCSPDHGLRGPEYRLWLKDHLAIYGVKNAILAPGYRVEPKAGA